MTNNGEDKNSITDSAFIENTVKEDLHPAPSEMLNRFSSLEVDPIANNLSKAEYKEAKQCLVKDSFVKFKFPRIYKSRIDPQINGQQYSLHSFIPAKGATPDKDGVFGIFKNRGNFSSQHEANEHCELLIRSIDSVNEIFIGYVGKEFPLTLTSNWCEETKEIDVKNKLDDIAKSKYKEQREKESKEIEEIQERQKKLLSENSESKQESKDDLDYYIMLRVKYANLKLSRENTMKQLQKEQDILEKSRNEIEQKNIEHPEYKEEYMKKYKYALESSGISVNDNPLIKFMNDLDDKPSEVDFKFPIVVPVKPDEKKENKDQLYLADKARFLPFTKETDLEEKEKKD
jgi:hypothetical protein